MKPLTGLIYYEMDTGIHSAAIDVVSDTLVVASRALPGLLISTTSLYSPGPCTWISNTFLQ